MMRRLLLILACFWLTGCWYGISLYGPSDARPAVPSGVYLATAKGETPKSYRVTPLPNGLTEFDGGEKKETYGFAPLDPARGAYVMWVPVKNEDPKTSDEPGEYQVYLLLVRVRDGEFRIYPPECKDVGADMARKNGAAIGSETYPGCQFKSRASLEAALRQLPRDEAEAATLKRVP
jgi:hypothetical protein